MAIIYRPCYTTREMVRRALDVKQAAYNDVQLDRQVLSGAESVDTLCNRQFYPEKDTRFWDWPNYQYSNPWRLWLDSSELADVTVNPPVVISGGVTIPAANILWGDPLNPDPPFNYMELRRDKSSSFGNGPTPQREISIQGTYGYWLKSMPAGSLSAAMTDTTGLLASVTDGATPGVGDIMMVDTEWMIVTDARYVDTGISFSGLSSASASDAVMTVANGALFFPDETIQVDSEWLLIQNIQGNSLIVKRAWGGSILSAHTSGTIYARRSLTVLRGQLGTTAATHLINAPISTAIYPGMVTQLATAEAIVGLTMEPSAYATSAGPVAGYASSGMGASGRQVTREPIPGPGLPDLRDRVCSQYGRKVRTRAV